MTDDDRTAEIRARLEADRNRLLNLARTWRCPKGCECGADASVATKLSAAVPDLLADMAHLLAENAELRDGQREAHNALDMLRAALGEDE